MSKINKHAGVCKELNDLYAQKNHDYGDSFGKLYTSRGIDSAVVQILHKVHRLDQITQRDAVVSDETIRDTLIDLANYAVMTIVEMENEREA